MWEYAQARACPLLRSWHCSPKKSVANNGRAEREDNRPIFLGFRYKDMHNETYMQHRELKLVSQILFASYVH